jgi:hypothetical protein
VILNYNKSHEKSIKIKNLILSNPLVDVPTERMHQHELGFAIGLYDDSQIEQVETLRKHCDEAKGLGLGPSDQSAACKAVLDYITEPTGGVDQMDARYFDYDGMPDSDPFQYLFKNSSQKVAIKKALHITKTSSFSKLNSNVAEALQDREEDSSDLYTELLD